MLEQAGYVLEDLRHYQGASDVIREVLSTRAFETEWNLLSKIFTGDKSLRRCPLRKSSMGHCGSIGFPIENVL